VNIKIEVDADYSFGHEVFGRNPPIPSPGASVEAPGEATVTLENLIERRSGEALTTFAIILGIAANISHLVQFAAWIAEKLKSDGKTRVLRINGRHVGTDEAAIRDFLKQLAEDDSD